MFDYLAMSYKYCN